MGRKDYSDSESPPRDRKEKKEKKSKKEKRYSDSESPPRRKKEKRSSRRDDSRSRSRDRRRDRSRDRRDDSRDRGRGGYDDRRRDDRGDRGRGGYDEDFSRSVAGRYPGRMRHEMMRADGDTARVDEEKVSIILSQRIEAKRNKDFFTSDRLRDQLRQQFGVEVMDRECKWWSMRGGQGPAINVDYGRHDYARTDDLPGVDVEEIDKLLSQRLHARRTHDYFHADNLRSQLNRMGVEVDDRARSWTATERAQKPGFEDHNGRRDDDEPRGGGRGGGGGRRRGGSPEGGDSAEGGDSPERVDGGKGAAGESEE